MPVYEFRKQMFLERDTTWELLSFVFFQCCANLRRMRAINGNQKGKDVSDSQPACQG